MGANGRRSRWIRALGLRRGLTATHALHAATAMRTGASHAAMPGRWAPESNPRAQAVGCEPLRLISSVIGECREQRRREHTVADVVQAERRVRDARHATDTPVVADEEVVATTDGKHQ